MTIQNRTGRIGRSNYPKLLDLIAAGQTAEEISDHLRVFAETIRKFARKRGLKIQRHDMSMENHPSWKDGTTEDKHGYILRRVRRDGPYGYLIRTARRDGNSGYALEHRIVMHDKLGRHLLREEVVHHVDDNKKNNDPANLEVFATNAEHLQTTLAGKIPNWTPEGKSRMTGRPPLNRPQRSLP